MTQNLEEQLKASYPGKSISNLVLRIKDDCLCILGDTTSYYNKQIVGQEVSVLLKKAGLNHSVSNDVLVHK
jgi:hypothetical protein